MKFFVIISGHDVEGEQKQVVVDDISGHIDCIIDGEVVDIKTASGFAFNKFKNATLRDDDPFGYIGQLAGYEESEGTSNGGLLVINKENGELCFYQPEELDKPNIRSKIKQIKKALKLKNPPEEYCYPTVPDGAKVMRSYTRTVLGVLTSLSAMKMSMMVRDYEYLNMQRAMLS